MQVIVKPKEILALVEQARWQGKLIGFAPTMGSLHEGHLSLMERARTENQLVVSSLFVNPIQFAPDEDLNKYPRDFERDRQLAEQAGVDILFCPPENDFYDRNHLTYVEVESLSQKLCGASRPTHFRGVATVITKLFNIVKPHNAYFGQKDAQQFVIIKRLVTDLNFDLNLHMLPVVREAEGLAKSSRNQYLSLTEKRVALVLYRSLQTARELFESGERQVDTLVNAAKAIIAQEDLARLVYLSATDMIRLDPVKTIATEPVLLAGAIFVGQTRLIDNIIFNREQYYD